MGGKFLKLRTFVIAAVIAVFAFSIHPLTPRDFYETFRDTLRDPDDPVALQLHVGRDEAAQISKNRTVAQNHE